MKINNQTGQMSCIKPAERAEMTQWAKTVVLTGKVPSPDPKWLLEWMTVMDYSTREQHYKTATSFLQILLLSLVLEESSPAENE